MAGNQKFGNAYFLWSEFDALPRRLRNIIAHAPYHYSVTNLLKEWRESGDLDFCAQWLIDKSSPIVIARSRAIGAKIIR